MFNNILSGKALIICLLLLPASLYAQTVFSSLPYLTQGIISYYSFDTIHNNRISNPVNAEFGAEAIHVKSIEGRQNGALEFNNISGMVLMDSLPYTESFTIMAWLKPYSYSNDPDAMLVFEKCMSFYMNIISQDGRFEKKKGHLRCGGYFTTEDGKNGWEYINAVDSIALNEWTHAAVTFSSGSYKLYVNGKLVNEKQIRPKLIGSNLPASWGAKYNPKFNGFDGWFHGIIDECFLFSRALSSNEIETYFSYTSK